MQEKLFISAPNSQYWLVQGETITLTRFFCLGLSLLQLFPFDQAPPIHAVEITGQIRMQKCDHALHTPTPACKHARTHTHFFGTWVSYACLCVCAYGKLQCILTKIHVTQLMLQQLAHPKIYRSIKNKNNNQHEKLSRTQFMGRFYSCTNDKTVKDHDIADLKK